MSATLAVLRPEPGNAATARRIEALGHIALRLPLFEVRPLVWDMPDLAGVDALLVTSANAIRHGGPGLAALRHLPVVAVGAATARAAEAAGFDVKLTGAGGVAEVLRDAGDLRLLHLAGRDRVQETGLPTLAVYASEPLPIGPTPLAGTIALIHSPRAGVRLAEIMPVRRHTAIAALSAAVLAAAGIGWRSVAVAERPTDEALIAAALALAD